MPFCGSVFPCAKLRSRMHPRLAPASRISSCSSCLLGEDDLDAPSARSASPREKNFLSQRSCMGYPKHGFHESELPEQSPDVPLQFGDDTYAMTDSRQCVHRSCSRHVQEGARRARAALKSRPGCSGHQCRRAVRCHWQCVRRSSTRRFLKRSASESLGTSGWVSP